MHAELRIGVLISGGGTNLQSILDACRKGHIDGRVVFVGSDRPTAGGLARATREGVPVFVVDYGSIIRDYKKAPARAVLPFDFDLAEVLPKQAVITGSIDPESLNVFLTSRAIAEAHLLEAMRPYPFDLLVLAGFMRTLTPYFIDHVNRQRHDLRIMNIHPALLPAFPGVDGYGDTFRYGCKVGGCTVHFVDYGQDSGPIIAQRTFRIEEDDNLETVRKKGLQMEWALYPECIQLFAQGRLACISRADPTAGGGLHQRTVVKILPPG